MSSTQAKENIFSHIEVEVFLGHNAIGVYIALSDHSSTLNRLPFYQALGTMQRHALDAFILSLCKLYERPSKKYPNPSIPSTLDLLEKHPSGLAAGIQNSVCLEQFIQARVDNNFAVRGPDDIAKIPELILAYFKEWYPRTPPRDGNTLDKIFDALKVLRDKRVAHYEYANMAHLNKTDLDGALQLLAFAQTFINIVGYGLFGSSREGEVDTNRFAPAKSVVWPELNRMIELLESDNQGEPPRAVGWNDEGIPAPISASAGIRLVSLQRPWRNT